MNQKMLDEKFDREQTSFNIIQHDFFLLFYFFLNFERSQMHPTFHPTSKMLDVLWNFLVKVYIQLTLENSNCQGTKKIDRVIESRVFEKWTSNNENSRIIIIGYILCYFNVKSAIQQICIPCNLIYYLKEISKTAFFQACCLFLIQKGLYFQNKSPISSL